MSDFGDTTPSPVQQRSNAVDAYDFLIAASAGATGMLVLLAAFFSTGILSSGGLVTTIILPLAFVSTGLIALLKPHWTFYGFITLSMVFPHELDGFFIPLTFMKVYPQDLLYLFLIAVCLFKAFAGKLHFHQLKYNKWMVLYIGLGMYSAAVGLLLTGNEYDNVFGDFRRSFFYFLSYFFALALTGMPREIKFLKLALCAGAIAVIFRGILQAALGDFVTRRFGDAAHIMNHFEVTFSTLAIYIGLVKLTLGTRHRLLWLALSLSGTLIVVLGNFRTCWIGLFGGLAVLFFLLPSVHKRQLLIITSIAFIIGAGFLAALWNVDIQESHSTIGENIFKKADLTATRSDTNVSWRMDSYENAVRLWKTQPIAGRGLGEELEFITTTSTGKPMMAMGHRVHNSYLWLLMSLGVVGFAVLCYIHWRYICTIYATLKLPGLTKGGRTTLTVGSAFYATILISALFDVYLESAPPITILSVVMALCLLTVRYEGLRI